MDTKITLAQAVRDLRTQLEDAIKEGEGQKIRFVPRSVEVQLGVTFTIETEAGGGFKVLSLVDVSAKGSRDSTSQHIVKLLLEPVGADGKPTLIRDSEREAN